MRESVLADLETRFNTRVVQQLHDVPPHEVYELTVDGRRAVYKGDTGPTGSAGLEGRVLNFVGRETGVPVPDVLLVGTDYYVAESHSAAPDPAATRTPDRNWAIAAGRGLATLHAETAPVIEQYGQFQPAGDTVAVSGHDEWHDAALAYLRRRRPVLARYGHADMADAVIDLLADRPGAFSGAGGAVCCHGWATPAHVSVADGRVTCMIDFEHAIAAPGEFDYWRTVVPTFDTDGAARRAFREGYESVRPLPEGMDRRAPLYRLLNAVYYFESLYVQEQYGPDETEKRAESLREHVTATVEDLS